MLIKDILHGVGTQIRSLAMIFSHSWHKRDTLCYPEEQVYLAPRYRGRIVLTRDPDGDERCVACNLCAVACPVSCISVTKKQNVKMGAGIQNFSGSIFSLYFLRVLRRSLSNHGHSADAGF